METTWWYVNNLQGTSIYINVNGIFILLDYRQILSWGRADTRIFTVLYLEITYN